MTAIPSIATPTENDPVASGVMNDLRYHGGHARTVIPIKDLQLRHKNICWVVIARFTSKTQTDTITSLKGRWKAVVLCPEKPVLWCNDELNSTDIVICRKWKNGIRTLHEDRALRAHTRTGPGIVL